MNTSDENVVSTSYNSATFYRQRAAQSRKMEIAARSPMIALIHRDLAGRYDVLAETAHKQETI